MAEAGDSKPMMTINVKLNKSSKIAVNVDPKWNIARLKQEISKRSNTPVDEINIIFQGCSLHDEMNIQHADLGNNSVLHMMSKDRTVELEAQLPSFTPESIAPVSIVAIPEHYKSLFYVFCKSQCNDVRAGKIRVRCKKCGYGGFLLDRDPQSWDDVLKPNQISGKCDEGNCDGRFADFYFKCKSHDTEEQETSVALNLVRPNPQEVPCITCFGAVNPVVQWPCDQSHAMCLDCFKDYGLTGLNNRQYFIQKANVGYTLKCPAPQCEEEESYVKEPHHFRIFGPDQYNRYQNFATEEFVLNEGGVLCPSPNCGNPILPEHGPLGREIRCFCGYIFCKDCKEAYHNGECHTVESSGTQNGANGGRFEDIAADHANQAAMRVITEISKPCPHCNAPTEKNGGCMHMTCIRCKFDWCWMCRIEWGRECQSDHWFG